MEEYERQAIIGLLSKQVETQETLAKQRKIAADANEAIAAATKAQSHLKSAFLAFGFEVGTAELWNKVRDAVGVEEYNKAIDIGKGNYHPSPMLIENKRLYSSQRENNEQDELDGIDDASAREIEKIDENVVPKIREIVLEQLQIAYPEGIKAGDAKAFIEMMYRLKMHEKTVGMTLWRLSREGKARRDGRQWFYVVPQDEPEEADEPF